MNIVPFPDIDHAALQSAIKHEPKETIFLDNIPFKDPSELNIHEQTWLLHSLEVNVSELMGLPIQANYLTNTEACILLNRIVQMHFAKFDQIFAEMAMESIGVSLFLPEDNDFILPSFIAQIIDHHGDVKSSLYRKNVPTTLINFSYNEHTKGFSVQFAYSDNVEIVTKVNIDPVTYEVTPQTFLPETSKYPKEREDLVNQSCIFALSLGLNVK